LHRFLTASLPNAPLTGGLFGRPSSFCHPRSRPHPSTNRRLCWLHPRRTARQTPDQEGTTLGGLRAVMIRQLIRVWLHVNGEVHRHGKRSLHSSLDIHGDPVRFFQ